MVADGRSIEAVDARRITGTGLVNEAGAKSQESHRHRVAPQDDGPIDPRRDPIDRDARVGLFEEVRLGGTRGERDQRRRGDADERSLAEMRAAEPHRRSLMSPAAASIGVSAD